MLGMVGAALLPGTRLQPMSSRVTVTPHTTTRLRGNQERCFIFIRGMVGVARDFGQVTTMHGITRRYSTTGKPSGFASQEKRSVLRRRWTPCGPFTHVS